MIETTKWADRNFDFNFPIGITLELLERLRGTPTRLAERVDSLPDDLLRKRAGENWSIQEHAGHLMDVEQLFLGRLDDYEIGLTELRSADISGRKTFDANHNERDIGEVLAGFHTIRGKLVSRLAELDATGFARMAHHPRSNRPMRLCDMLLLEATHDDYHLVEITKRIRELGKNL